MYNSLARNFNLYTLQELGIEKCRFVDATKWYDKMVEREHGKPHNGSPLRSLTTDYLH
jgi:hypothetical protein